MKLLIIVLTMIFISFKSFAKETVYDCMLANWKMKVEDPLFGKRKLFSRVDGGWNQICKEKTTIISDDGFKCFYGEKNKLLDYFVLDEKFKTLTVYNKKGKSREYNCYVK